MLTLRQVGQMASDLFYQNYKADDQFFDLEHFKFLLAAEYVKQVQAESTANKRENKQFSGFSYIEVSTYWLKTERVKVTTEDGVKTAVLTQQPFQFNFDSVGSGVQYVETVAEGKTIPCAEVIRIAYNDKWMACAMPPNQTTFYYVKGDKIHILNSHCNLQEIEVSYVPAPLCYEDDDFIHQDKAHDIIRTVLNTMFGAKNGNIVDMSDNSNPNSNPATDLSNAAVNR